VTTQAYFFGGGQADGNRDMKELLGGKGANLAEMTRGGFPVPPGFTLTTATCEAYFEADSTCPDSVDVAMVEMLGRLEALHGRKLGDADRPLLLSVRSGAAVSMPGMMDTVLNLGLNDQTVVGLERETGNKRYAYDCYRRFIQMFSDVVLEVPHKSFEKLLKAAKDKRGVAQDTDLTAEDLVALVGDYERLVEEVRGEPFPQDTLTQLRLSRDAVYRSFYSDRAIEYRRINKLTGYTGTAVNVQAMVFGNRGNTSGSGVGFTRDPSTGVAEPYGEYLLNAQGEDVVAGIRTPHPISHLKEEMPAVYDELMDIADRLEKHYADMQDFEFTIEDNKLYMLQTRSGKRTGQAAIRIANDMLAEGVIDARQAVLQVHPDQIEQILHKIFVPNQVRNVLGKGLPASPGAAVGVVAFTADEAVAVAEGGTPVILVREETSPDDIAGMHVAMGILTARGGRTSHAAVVARQMGTCCVAGCVDAHVDDSSGVLTIGGVTLKSGDWLSLDGTAGEVIAGRLEFEDPDLEDPQFVAFMKHVDGFRSLGVRTNADQPEDVIRARAFGAEGIGLCRTEHMFFAPDRLPVVQSMILAEKAEDRQAALDKLLPFQRADFDAIFEAMEGLPCTIRLLDPPLHEFLPSVTDLAVEVTAIEATGYKRYAPELWAERSQLLERAKALHEQNPMLGNRGCRLGVSYPGITRMQSRAILEAAVDVAGRGVDVKPEIMIPLIGTAGEFNNQRAIVLETAEKVFAEKGRRVDFLVGTMIEMVRACLVADEVAETAQFFSFGTNDLTQTTFGYSRDDCTKVIGKYLAEGILTEDPFAHLDQRGVGQLVQMAVDRGRQTNAKLKIGICGEHGGDPASIDFCRRAGLNYVSCSPFRVPVARLAAAQSELRAG